MNTTCVAPPAADISVGWDSSPVLPPQNTDAAEVPSHDANSPPNPPPLPPRLKIPSERDLWIYEQVVIYKMSQYEVAEESELSQPRVHQILQEMSAWVADNTPGLAASLTQEQQLRLVHYNSTRQLEHHHECLMEAWRNSIGNHVTTRVSTKETGPHKTEVKRWNYGEIRYLREASRLALQMRKAGMTPPPDVSPAPQDSPYWQLAAEEEAREAREAERESGDGGQEAEGREQETGDTEQHLSRVAEMDESSPNAAAHDDPVIADLRATCAAQNAQIRELEVQERKLRKALSDLPLELPVEAEPANGRRVEFASRSKRPIREHDPRNGDKFLQRQSFLSGQEPPATVADTIRERYAAAEG